MSSNSGVAPAARQNGGDSTKETRLKRSVSLAQEGSRLSQAVIGSVEQLRTLLDLMIDERVSELLEQRNRLPRFGDEAKCGLANIDQQLSDYTNRKVQSWQLIDEVVRELKRYEVERREHASLPFLGSQTSG